MNADHNIALTLKNLARKALIGISDAANQFGLVGSRLRMKQAAMGSFYSYYHTVGAEIDSYYEYLLKAAILFEDDELMDIFETSYQVIKKVALHPSGFHIQNFDAVGMYAVNQNVESLSAFFRTLGKKAQMQY